MVGDTEGADCRGMGGVKVVGIGVAQHQRRAVYRG